MNFQNLKQDQPFLKSYIKGSRRLSNIFWALVVSAGGVGFLMAGLSSFLKINLFIFSRSSEILFIPQGIVLLFYGTVGSILGIFLWLTIWWDIGFGYNYYSKEKQKVYIYRKGFPGKNSELNLVFKFEELKSIKLSIFDGLNPKRQLFLCLKDNREIPLSGSEQLVALNKIEVESLTLANYLNIYLETN
jgi:hypothetical protein